MKRKSFLIFTSITLLILIVFTGCGAKPLPFSISPENSLKVDVVEQSVKNADENHKIFEQYNQYKLSGVMSNDLKSMLEKKKAGKTDEEYQRIVGQYAMNGDKVFTMHVAYLKPAKATELDKIYVEYVQDYIKYTRMSQGKLSIDLYPEFNKQDPAVKVKEYMDKEKIVVTDVDLPNIFVSKDLSNYPFKFTYRYALKGTVNGKAFEKEVVQDFFMGWEDDIKGNGDVLYAVKDAVESKK